MLSKTTLVASAAAVTLALMPGALAAPAPAQQPLKYCYKIGSGVLGMPSKGIVPYTQSVEMQPVAPSADGYLVSTNSPTPFDYYSCDGGSTGDEAQGYILASNGQCLTAIEPNSEQPMGFKTADCIWNPNNQFRGAVADSQHFQFKKWDFANGLIVNFVGSQNGPVPFDFTNLWSFNRGGYPVVKNYDCDPHGACEGQRALYAAL